MAYPLDGSFIGQSGRSPVRIGDLSVTGCFVESLGPMAAGDRVEPVVEARLDLHQPVGKMAERQHQVQVAVQCAATAEVHEHRPKLRPDQRG